MKKNNLQLINSNNLHQNKKFNKNNKHLKLKK